MKNTIMKNGLLTMLICSLNWGLAQSYNGKFSSEGDITAKGIMTMEVTQNKAKVEGVATYKSYDGSMDAGMLSVNGYVKDGVAYVRFRDQRGNVVGDGDVHFQGDRTLHFTQSTSNNVLPKSAFLYSLTHPEHPVKMTSGVGYFTGKYSNEGDTTAKGILSFDMQQTGAKLEGTATYTSMDGSVQSGLLSVNGYSKNGVGYIRFRDQRGNVVADATLKKSGNTTEFSQTTNSSWLPKSAFLYR